MDKIYFHDFNAKSFLRNKLLIKKFLLELFKDQNTQIKKLDIIFCTDPYLRSINRKFLHHNYNTDTISFIYSNLPVTGEIYISIDRIKKNSGFFKVSYEEELMRVIIHGCLHLCGFKDKPKSNYLKMSLTQEKYLQNWIVSRETQIG